MNRCEAIRDLMQKTGRPMKPGEVIAALPQYSAAQVRDSINLMYHHAVPPILDREGNKSDGFAYFVVRSVQIKAYPTEESARARRRERELIRHRRRRGGGSLAELRARQAEVRRLKGEAKAQARAAQAAERARKREAEREATRLAAEAKRREQAKRRAQRRLSPAQRVLAHAPAVVAAERPAPRVQRVETVEEWQARTGKRPQRIPAAWERRA